RLIRRCALLLLPCVRPLLSPFFFFNATATTEIYTLSLHDALPISLVATHARVGVEPRDARPRRRDVEPDVARHGDRPPLPAQARSEEHTSELQSQSNLVCRLLLEKKKKKQQPARQYRHATQKYNTK